MDYLLGFLGGLCVGFVIFSLIVASSMQNMIMHVKNLRIVVEDRIKRETPNDADWWKHGCQEDEPDEDEQLDS